MKVNAREWPSRLQSGQWPPVVLLHGGDQGLVDRAALAIRDRVVADDPGALEFDVTRLVAGEIEAMPLRQALQAGPWFASKRLVLVREVDGLSAECRQVVVTYLSRPVSSTLLVLTGTNLSAQPALRKALEADPNVWCVAFYPLSGEELRRWLSGRLTAMGYRLDSGAGAALAQRLEGGDSALAEQELAKLCNYVGEGRLIDQAAVLAVVGETSEATAYLLMEAILRGEVAGALAMVDRLLESGEEPLMILGLIASRLRRLAQGMECLAQSLPPQVIAAKLQLFWKEEALFLNSCRRLPPQVVTEGLGWCLEADLRLKGFEGTPSPQVLGGLIMRLAKRFRCFNNAPSPRFAGGAS